MDSRALDCRAGMVYARRTMSTEVVRLHRWDEIALEKVTEMLSRKIVTGEREMLAQVYLKAGCIVPMHAHQAEALDDTFSLDVFSPIRQDWLDHTDDYFRR